MGMIADSCDIEKAFYASRNEKRSSNVTQEQLEAVL